MSHSRYCSCHRAVAPEIKFDVNANPSTYRPNMDVSPHLEFVKANVDSVEMKLQHLMELQRDYEMDPQMPDAVFNWLEVQQQRECEKIDHLMKREHETNAYLLAERVIHKFVKWGPVRFGLTPLCQNDFYDGSRAINSLDNPVRFEPVFRNFVMKLARKAGLNGDQILRNLHIGLHSAQRFSEFIDVDIPVIVDEEEDDDCDCFLCTQDSEDSSDDSDEDLPELDEDSEADSEDEKIAQDPSEAQIPVPKPTTASVTQANLD